MKEMESIVLKKFKSSRAKSNSLFGQRRGSRQHNKIADGFAKTLNNVGKKEPRSTSEDKIRRMYRENEKLLYSQEACRA